MKKTKTTVIVSPFNELKYDFSSLHEYYNFLEKTKAEKSFEKQTIVFTHDTLKDYLKALNLPEDFNSNNFVAKNYVQPQYFNDMEYYRHVDFKHIYSDSNNYRFSEYIATIKDTETTIIHVLNGHYKHVSYKESVHKFVNNSIISEKFTVDPELIFNNLIAKRQNNWKNDRNYSRYFELSTPGNNSYFIPQNNKIGFEKTPLTDLEIETTFKRTNVITIKTPVSLIMIFGNVGVHMPVLVYDFYIIKIESVRMNINSSGYVIRVFYGSHHARNPHLVSYGEHCFGNMKDSFSNILLKETNYLDSLVDIFIGYLTYYNPESYLNNDSLKHFPESNQLRQQFFLAIEKKFKFDCALCGHAHNMNPTYFPVNEYAGRFYYVSGFPFPYEQNYETKFQVIDPQQPSFSLRQHCYLHPDVTLQFNSSYNYYCRKCHQLSADVVNPLTRRSKNCEDCAHTIYEYESRLYKHRCFRCHIKRVLGTKYQDNDTVRKFIMSTVIKLSDLTHPCTIKGCTNIVENDGKICCEHGKYGNCMICNKPITYEDYMTGYSSRHPNCNPSTRTCDCDCGCENSIPSGLDYCEDCAAGDHQDDDDYSDDEETIEAELDIHEIEDDE